jgi:hypothetical protein
VSILPEPRSTRARASRVPGADRPGPVGAGVLAAALLRGAAARAAGQGAPDQAAAERATATAAAQDAAQATDATGATGATDATGGTGTGATGTGSTADGADAPAAAELRVARPATVNGESITSEDIANQARLLNEERPGMPLDELLRLSRRQIAEQILLAGDATRRGVELTERDVDDYWERRRGAAPDYGALAAETGTSVERQKALARRAALAELYLLHRIGLRMDFARQVPPEPLLVRLVTITPSQLRDAFATNKELLDVPEHVRVDVYACPDAEAGEALCEALAAGDPPDGVEPLERVVPVTGLERNFPAATAAFLREAPAGSCRVDVGAQGGFVLVIRGHEAARPARFDEVQERLRLMLQRELIEEARQHLVAALEEEASCWPRDLFSP